MVLVASPYSYFILQFIAQLLCLYLLVYHHFDPLDANVSTYHLAHLYLLRSLLDSSGVIDCTSWLPTIVSCLNSVQCPDPPRIGHGASPARFKNDPSDFAEACRRRREAIEELRRLPVHS